MHSLFLSYCKYVHIHNLCFISIPCSASRVTRAVGVQQLPLSQQLQKYKFCDWMLPRDTGRFRWYIWLKHSCQHNNYRSVFIISSCVALMTICDKKHALPKYIYWHRVIWYVGITMYVYVLCVMHYTALYTLHHYYWH